MVDNKLHRFNERRGLALLLILLLGDLAFIVLHMLNSLGSYFTDPLFNIETNKGYAETYQYLKYFGIAITFSLICIKKKTQLFLPWVLLFVYFF